MGIILGVTAAGAAEDAAPARRMTVDDLMGIRNLHDPQISPDGSRVAYVVSRPDRKRNQHDSDIRLISVRGGEPVFLTAGPGRDDSPCWSPDGKWIAFISDRGGRPQVWKISPDGGEAVPVTDLESGVGRFAWSPDGRRLALLLPDPPGEGKEAAAPGETPDAPYPPAEVLRPGEDPPCTHIHLIDAAGGSPRRLTSGDFTVETLDWSPDGHRIVFSARPSTRVPDLFNSDLFVVETAGGEVRELVKRPGPDTAPRFSPDGNRIAFISTDTRMEWIADWVICLVPSAGGPIRNLTRDFGEYITACTWSADGRSLFFQANRGVTVQLFAVDAGGGGVRQISEGLRVYSAFSFSRDTRRAAFTVSDPALPHELFISDVESFRPERLTDTNPQLQGIALGEMEVVSWKSRDGLAVEGILLKPADFRPGRRYPLLTYAHGGPSGKFGISFSPQIGGGGSPIQGESYPLQVLAGEGFAVLMPNVRGSYGYGETFRKANVRDWGGGDFQDLMSGIDALIERGVADPDRLGIMGRSYGGYMTAWAITQTDRFKAASLGAGMSNLISFFGQTDIPGFMEYYFGGDVWEARDLYWERSPLTYARRVTTPTLITQGEADPRVPLPQAKEYFHALKRAGVEVDFVVYPRQGHMIYAPRMQADMLNRNLEWFRSRLSGH